MMKDDELGVRGGRGQD